MTENSQQGYGDIKLTFEIDYGMLSAILDAKILLYVTVLKSTNDHFSYICIGC